MADGAKTNLQSADVVGKLFGITPRYVRILTSDGVIRAEKVKNKNMYDLLPTIQAYIRHLTAKVEAKSQKKDSTVQAEADKLRAESKLKQSKAKIAEIKCREFESKMHRAEDVEAMTSDLLYTIREKIESLPDRLAVDVVGAPSANEASVMIRSECYKILNELAGYEYDPESYQRRVRDREGWSDTTSDD